MGIFSNRIEVEDLKPGDHIYTWRGPFLYAHHGIYIGEGEVIHFGANPNPTTECEKCNQHKVKSERRVSKSCLRCFLDGGKLYRYLYGVSRVVQMLSRRGTVTRLPASKVEDILYRAHDMLNNKDGFGEYNFVGRNCEDFALYCTLGIKPETIVSSILGVGNRGVSSQASRLFDMISPIRVFHFFGWNS